MNAEGVRSAGRTFSEAELRIVCQIVAAGGRLSRTQLMVQVCRRLRWQRPNGALKVRECRDLFAMLQRSGRLACRRSAARAPAVAHRGAVHAGWRAGTASMRQRRAVPRTPGAGHDCRRAAARYHYLATGIRCRTTLPPFVSEPTTTLVRRCNCPRRRGGWRRATWIGWDEPTRTRNLQRVVNNSRFLVLPWVRVKNLASRLLALLAGRLAADWQQRFAVEPLLPRRGWIAVVCRHATGRQLDRVGRHGRSGTHGPIPVMGKRRSGFANWWTRNAGWRRAE